jgi:threonine dehydratase
VSRINLEAIERARHVIAPPFLRTPQFVAESLNAAVGVEVLVKVEVVNPIRSFKGRGADFFVQELADRNAHLVCASAGNFGQGLAYAARRRDMRLDVFASTVANPLKIERMRTLGAAVHLAGNDFDAAKAAAREYAAARGALYVEDGRIPEITEGAGTIGAELLDLARAPDVVVVPLGNGALLGGIATWMKARRPATRVVGVCAAGAPSMERSWRAHRPVETPTADTIADGIAVRVPIPEAVNDLQDVVDDIVLVTDAELVVAMRLLMQHLGLLIEPAGAAGVAAIAKDPGRYSSAGLSATILCGGNVTEGQRREWGL